MPERVDVRDAEEKSALTTTRELPERPASPPLSRDLTAAEQIHCAIALANLGRLQDALDAMPLAALQQNGLAHLVRRLAIAPALRESRFADAEALLRRVIAANPGHAADIGLLATVMIRAGKRADGHVVIEQALTLAPDNLTWAAQAILGRLQAGDAAEAAALALRYEARWIDHPRLAQMASLAFTRAGDRAGEGRLADRILAADSADPHTILAAAQSLLQSRRPQDALTLCERVFVTGKSLPRLRLVAAQAMIALDGPEGDIIAALEAARAGAGQDAPILRTLGEMLVRVGRYAEAAEVLGEAVRIAPNLPKARMLHATALKFSRNYPAAAAAILAAEDLHGDRPAWQRQATAALLQAGRTEDAGVIYADLIETRRSNLPDRFADHLAILHSQRDRARIPDARLDWAWAVSNRITGGDPTADRTDWTDRARWGHLADRAILDWLECRPERVAEIAALLDGAQPAVAPILDLLRGGKGVLIASAHLGPMYAGPVVLQAGGVPYKVLASTPRISTAPYADALISTIDQTEVQVVRQVIAALHAGQAVIMAIDGAMNPTAPRVPWHGASITYSDFMAAAAFRLSVPSVFAQPYWKDGRIAFVVNVMPTPDPGEAQDAYVARWRAAFFVHVSAYFHHGPENLRLAGGLWRNIAWTAMG